MSDEPSEPQQQSQSSPSPTAMLDYRSGIDERRAQPRVPVPLQATISFFGSAGIIAGGGFISAAAFSSVLAGLAAVVLVSVFLGLFARHLRDRDDDLYRGWAVGIWLGIGIVGLLDGLCFVVLAGM
jgi:hypothetical protein